jgi:hypothetical protein
MISRKATTKLELLYEVLFTEESSPFIHGFVFEELWKFLYEQDIEGWFLDSIKDMRNPLDFRNMVLGLHLGILPARHHLGPRRRQEIGQQILWQMTIAVLKFRGPDLDNDKVKDRDEVILTRALVRQLEMDGYVYRNETLYSTESTVIPEEEEQSYLESLVKGLKLNDAETVIHHLKLSEEHFLDGKWDDSISNSRKVLDAILKQITEAVYLKKESTPAPAGLLKNATQTREYLENQGLITMPEMEALAKNYGLLSVTGGHPYIAEKDQARLMRHLALTFTQFVLLRYQGFLSKNP